MPIKVNGARLWENLMQMAKIGGTAKEGCNRQALTDLDIKGRALFSDWCRKIGLQIQYDAVGNMFARLDGRDNHLNPLVIGSHLDTQPTGGKYDGVLGVLAGLEVMTRIVEEKIIPERPIEIACWMNEEGARFAPAMMGSGVWAGMLDLGEVRASIDLEGISVGIELDRHGYSSHPDPQDKDIAAYLELHIEQGPVLEAEGKDVGVVTGAQGIRWYDVVLTGQETHAGPSPMAMRHDPMRLVPALVQGILEIGTRDEAARATIGQVHTAPFSRNVVPGKVVVSVDLRHPNEQVLQSMHDDLATLVSELTGEDRKLTSILEEIWHSPVVAFDAGLVTSIRRGAKELGYSYCDIVSGAGHDSLMVARKVPTAMIFTPCRDGISHNESEHIEPHQAEAGANVLLAAVLDYLGS
ncbi:N-carbamoyl-L-amino acid hydrolase [Ruegeria denitrificans]|uniref:N-carbamoyl-L-amino acid hydrolase n=1 Tax=Ruegeria denitrificans TaxID=1715692 RepID=A0A0P1IFS2_9RHOB|nr:Zn-dependent hydrolase [Ruegeria denitrificans]CUK10186.1 N-carbamoyl-L-amino acid hydrolase [Ruegeria denitrificans]